MYNIKLFYFVLPPHPQPLKGRGLRTWADPLQGIRGVGGRSMQISLFINRTHELKNAVPIRT